MVGTDTGGRVGGGVVGVGVLEDEEVGATQLGEHVKKASTVPTPGMAALVVAHTPGTLASVVCSPSSARITGDDVQLRVQSVTSHSCTCRSPGSVHVSRSEYCWFGSEITEQYTPVVRSDSSGPGGAQPGRTDKQPSGATVTGKVVEAVEDVVAAVVVAPVSWVVDAASVVVAAAVVPVAVSEVVVPWTVVVVTAAVVSAVVSVPVVARVVEIEMVRVTHEPGTHRICAGSGNRGSTPPGAQKPGPDNCPRYAPRFSDCMIAGSS